MLTFVLQSSNLHNFLQSSVLLGAWNSLTLLFWSLPVLTAWGNYLTPFFPEEKIETRFLFGCLQLLA